MNKQDWGAAIAKCTAIIDNHTQANTSPPCCLYDAYMNRGYARCFVPSKDDNYEKAAEDLSTAITLAPDNINWKAECLFKRAYAYYISGRYDCAIADCKEAIKLAGTFPFTDIVSKVYALTDKAQKMSIMAQNAAASKNTDQYSKLEAEAEKFKTEAEKIVNGTDALKTAVQEVISKVQEVVNAANEQNTDKTGEAARELRESVDKLKDIVSYAASAHELLGNIYSALDNPLEAVEQYKKVLSPNPPGSPSLLDNYRKVRERLNRSR